MGLHSLKAGHKAGGDLGDADVVNVGVGIKAAALGGDLLFQIGDASLKLHEVGVGLQVRIILRYGKERFERGLKALEEADLNIKRSRLEPRYAVEKLVVELGLLLRR